MLKLWGIYAGTLLYMELVYHLGGFGLSAGNPVFVLALIITIAGIQAWVTGIVPVKWKKVCFWIIMSISLALFGAQLVYLRIFRQPLMWEAALRGGQDALTNYWREALEGILKASPFLLLLSVPLITAGVLLHLKKWKLPICRSIQQLRLLLLSGVGIILSVMVILIGKYIGADYYEDYHEFYDPLTVAENMGVLSLVQRDTAVSIGSLFHNLGKGNRAGQSAQQPSGENLLVSATDDGKDAGMESQEQMEAGVEAPEEKLPDTSPNQLPIDFEKLKAEADSKETTWLAEYMEGLTPTTRNEYTGLFEGYNLIYLTAEGFSPYGVREDLTPTLYRLIHSGFEFTNYYVPLWQTSTSDGEYINCTALIPDGQFSMRKSSVNDMAFTLPRYFAGDGVNSLAYHNNSLSYYERHLTHTNLGYDFKAAKLGDLDEAEWGDKIFPMEHPDAWPSSDLEMMQGTIPEYINQDRFHVYYMTVSGHMNYNFTGNAMSAKNKDAVAGLDMSENARAYIACHIELDKALAYLLEQLEAAGKLENTVICMSADHYPYGMSEEEYEELSGKPLSENQDLYRNNLILWNVGMEASPVQVDKVCGSMDILPTLLNLFGFSYDSRLYAGRDIFSQEEGLVIFNDRSFVSDSVFYSRKNKTTVWRADLPELENKIAGPASEENQNGAQGDEAAQTGQENPAVAAIVPGLPVLADTQEAREQYMTDKKKEVKQRYQFSAYILQQNYYKNIREALPDE